MSNLIRYTLLIFFLLKISDAYSQDSINVFTPGQDRIVVRQDEPFRIKLRACHSCGYRWILEEADTVNIKLNNVSCTSVSKKFTIGGDVFEFWEFMPVRRGTYEMEFVLKGPGRQAREGGRCRFELVVD